MLSVPNALACSFVDISVQDKDSRIAQAEVEQDYRPRRM